MADDNFDSNSALARTSLGEIATLFLRLGGTAFGGPAAHIAMMEDEVVRRRAWLTHTEFLDLVAATNFIPGPNSTEMAIHIGYRRAGFKGLIVAGVCFILPAVLIVTAIAWAYVKFGSLPQIEGILYGVKPVIIAIVLQALWRLGKSAVKSRLLMIVLTTAIIATALGVNELLVLFAAGMIVMLARIGYRRSRDGLHLPLLATTLPATQIATTAAASTIAPVALSPLFLFFLKIGSVLFGSGYVLLAFIRSDLVDRLHWLSDRQLLDATAVGQITPGPLFTTATFIGYVLAGPKGAAVATVGIFLPAFFFVAVSGPIVPKLRHSPAASAFLDGLNVASLALMTVVTFQLGRAALVDPVTILLTVASAVVLLKFRINSSWLIFVGAIVGLCTTVFAKT